MVSMICMRVYGTEFSQTSSVTESVSWMYVDVFAISQKVWKVELFPWWSCRNDLVSIGKEKWPFTQWGWRMKNWWWIFYYSLWRTSLRFRSNFIIEILLLVRGSKSSKLGNFEYLDTARLGEKGFGKNVVIITIK